MFGILYRALYEMFLLVFYDFLYYFTVLPINKRKIYMYSERERWGGTMQQRSRLEEKGGKLQSHYIRVGLKDPALNYRYVDTRDPPAAVS